MLDTEVDGLTTKEFIDRIADNVIEEPKKKPNVLAAAYKLDLSFQSPSRWEESDRKEFLYSHMRGMNLSNFLYCDTKRCLENLESLHFGKGDVDYDYFAKWNGALLNIDSNNRSMTLIMAKDNQVPFPKGTYFTASGQPLRLAKDTYFKDLPLALQQVFDNTRILFTVIVSATHELLKQSFLAINNNRALNNQEIRQASCAAIADTVRDSVAKYNKVLANFFSDKDHRRRLSDETVAQIYVLGSIGIESSLSAKVLDKAYGHKTPSPSPDVQSKLRRISADFLPTLFDLASYLPLSKKMKEKNGKSTLINLAMILAEFRGINTKKILYDITDRSKFMQIFFEVEKTLRDSKEMVLESAGAWKTFSRICGASTADNLIERRKLIIWGMLAHDEIGECLVERLVQDEERPISVSVRYELWKMQSEKCRETSKVIPFSELLNTDLWQVDHIVPVTRGGTNDISNLQLICAKENNSMSNKLKTAKSLILEAA
jgi:hypothetical protein